MSYIISSDKYETNMNILIYGDPGAGKTHLAGTAQDHEGMKQVHVFNIDGGMMTLAERGDIRASDVASLEQLEMEMFKIANGDPEYAGIKTVVIDNVTELQTINLEAIVREELRTTRKKAPGASVDNIWQEDYGKSTKQIARILRGFRDLPLNKIYIAHRKDKLRKGTQIVEESKPSLTQMLGTAICGYMDYVWYLYQAVGDEADANGNNKMITHRYLLTQPFNNYLAKTRGNVFAQALGPVVTDPNMAEIYDLYLRITRLPKR